MRTLPSPRRRLGRSGGWARGSEAFAPSTSSRLAEDPRRSILASRRARRSLPSPASRDDMDVPVFAVREDAAPITPEMVEAAGAEADPPSRRERAGRPRVAEPCAPPGGPSRGPSVSERTGGPRAPSRNQASCASPRTHEPHRRARADPALRRLTPAGCACGTNGSGDPAGRLAWPADSPFRRQPFCRSSRVRSRFL
jgi:hypothetical protein